MRKKNVEVQGIDDSNYSEGYQENIKALNQDPRLLEFDALCHKVFTSADGKELMAMMYERFLVPMLVHPSEPNFKELLPFYEGVKEMVRTLDARTKSHEQYIEAAAKQGE